MVLPPPLLFFKGMCPRLAISQVHGESCFEANLSSISGSYGLLRVGCGVNYSYLRDTVTVSVVV